MQWIGKKCQFLLRVSAVLDHTAFDMLGKRHTLCMEYSQAEGKSSNLEHFVEDKSPCLNLEHQNFGQLKVVDI